jgi:hypothetical protein
MKVLGILAGIAALVFLADRLLLWLEWRGLIDYRRTYPGRLSGGQVGPAFLAIQSLLEPDKRHAAEEQTAVRTERDDLGDGSTDSAGKPGHSKLKS